MFCFSAVFISRIFLMTKSVYQIIFIPLEWHFPNVIVTSCGSRIFIKLSYQVIFTKKRVFPLACRLSSILMFQMFWIDFQKNPTPTRSDLEKIFRQNRGFRSFLLVLKFLNRSFNRLSRDFSVFHGLDLHHNF